MDCFGRGKTLIAEFNKLSFMFEIDLKGEVPV